MKTSRRSFLMQAAALSAAPFILPASVRAAETSPNDLITMGFIGTGKQSKHPDCKAYNDFRELSPARTSTPSASPRPTTGTRSSAIAALRRRQGRLLREAADPQRPRGGRADEGGRANRRVLQTGSMQRSSKEFRVACELVRNGAIGKVQRVECSFGDPGIPYDLPEEPMEPGLDWDMWLGPAPMRRLQLRAQPARRAQPLPELAQLPRVRRRHGHRLGRAPHRHRAVGPGHGRQRPGRGPPARRTAGAKRGATLVYANGVTVTHKDGFGVSLLRHRGRGPGQPRQVHLHAQRQADRQVHQEGGRPSLEAQVVKARRSSWPRTPRSSSTSASRPHPDFLDCVKIAPEADHQRGGRRPLRDLLPPDEPGLLHRVRRAFTLRKGKGF
jgi:hypothetical protein